MKRILLLVWLSVVVVFNSSLARTWYVLPDSSGDAPTIAAATDSATSGDTVLVAPGTYVVTYAFSDLIHPGPGVCLTSQGGPDVTVIEGCHPAYCIGLYGCDGARISGFTVRNSQEPECVYEVMWEEGISIYNCLDVIVEDCVIEGPFIYGIVVSGQVTAPDRPVIRNNHVSHCGYGLVCEGYYGPSLTPLFEGNVVTECGIGAYIMSSAPRFDRNSFTYCRIWGMQFEDICGGNCTRNLIAYNGDIGEYDDGGIWFGSNTYGNGPVFNESGDPEMANDIYGNIPLDVCAVTNIGLNELWVHCNYWGSRCPNFAGKCKGHVYYAPWVDSTHTRLLCFTDCPEATEPTTWGAIKAMYR